MESKYSWPRGWDVYGQTSNTPSGRFQAISSENNHNLAIVIPAPCGFDGNTSCNTDDLDALYEVFNTNVPPTDFKFDLNWDKVVDTADLDRWLILTATENGYSSPYLRGDTDLDRDIDLGDYNRLATNFNPSGTYAPYGWRAGNFDGNGNIDLTDYNALASNFHPLGYGSAPVPEPSTALLALLGMLLFSVFGRLSKNC